MWMNKDKCLFSRTIGRETQFYILNTISGTFKESLKIYDMNFKLASERWVESTGMLKFERMSL